MPKFCRVHEGRVIEGPTALPTEHEHIGQTILNFDLPGDHLTIFGWMAVEEAALPDYDLDTQHLVKSYEVKEDRVLEKIEVREGTGHPLATVKELAVIALNEELKQVLQRGVHYKWDDWYAAEDAVYWTQVYIVAVEHWPNLKSTTQRYTQFTKVEAQKLAIKALKFNLDVKANYDYALIRVNRATTEQELSQIREDFKKLTSQ